MRALSFPAPPPIDGAFGFASAHPSVGAAHRAGLERGIAFVLVLAALALATVCLPVLRGGTPRVQGIAPAAVPYR